MPSRARSLLLAAAVLATLGLTTSPASAATAKPERCAAGKVRLAPTAPCAAAKVKPGAAFEAPAAVRRDARFRRVAGRRATARAATLVRAVRERTPVARAARRARAAAADAAAWEPIEVGGVPGRMRKAVVETEGATPTQVTTVDTELSVTADGATLTIGVSVRSTLSMTACPDAAGVATGRTEEVRTERKTVVRGRERAFAEERRTRRAEVTVHVGDDALIAGATYQGTIDVEFRASGVSAHRYLAVWTKAAPLPGDPKADYVAELRRDPASLLAGTYRGPKGERFSEAEAALLIEARVLGQMLLEDDLRDLMRLMEGGWNAYGACVDVTLDPPSAALASGQTRGFTATANAKDGTPIGGAVKVIALDATADPETATMTAGTPLTFRLTMGDKDRATLIVEVKSKRGAGHVTIEIPRLNGWDVTFTATGTYGFTKSEHGDTDKGSAELAWTTTFHGIRFDGGQYDPFGATAIGGTMGQQGTLGTGHYTCTGTPWVAPAYNASLTPTEAAGGALRVRIMPFTAVIAERSTEQCAREGYGGDYGHIDGITHAEPYEAHVTVTPELLARGDFTLPVTRDADFPANCGEPAQVACSESGQMTGTVHFVRR